MCIHCIVGVSVCLLCLLSLVQKRKKKTHYNVYNIYYYILLLQWTGRLLEQFCFVFLI